MSEFFENQWRNLIDESRENETTSPGPDDIWNLALGWVIEECRAMFRDGDMPNDLCHELQARCRREMSVSAKVIRHDA